MTELAIITRKNGRRNAVTATIDAREVSRAGLSFLHALSYGSIVQGDIKNLDTLRARGYRVKIIPDAHLIRLNDVTINTILDTDGTTGDADEGLILNEADTKSWTHHLILFSGPNNPQWIGTLENIGLDVVEPVSPTAVLAVGTTDAVDAARALPFVRWTGPMQPRYRLSADLLEREGLVKYLRVGVYPGEALDEMIQAIETRNGKVARFKKANPMISNDYAELIVEIAADHIIEIARQPNTRFVEYASPEPGLEGERETQISAENLDGSAAPNTAPVVGYQAWLTAQGLSGAGTTIAICDTGVDANANNNTAIAHSDLQGRQTAFIDYTGGLVTTDTDGHGTHVAGIAVGNAGTGEIEGAAPNNFLWGQGMAPGANYVTQNALSGPWPPANWGTLTTDAVSNGANVMNNSWWDLGGAGAGYTPNSRSFDMLVRDPDSGNPGNQNLTLVFSAGNSGSGVSTITSPKEAKNIIAVGNSLTFRPGTGDIDDIRGLRISSSRGPAIDGRIMPDVVAPGTNVSAAYSRTSWRLPIAGTGSPEPGNPANTIDQYLSLTGTSMAAPHVSGCAALIIEWWRSLTGGANPSPAMIKALLINGAEDVTGGPNATGGGIIASIPNNDVGWGRVSMENIVQQFPASDRGPRIILDQSHAFTANGQEYQVRVAPVDPARPMRVTLVWTDAPGAANANPALVNDLDLEITETSSGNTYLGNINFTNGFSQPAAPGDVADTLNNVECVYLQNPSGVYEITVVAGNLQANARPPFDMTPWQDFALVIDNAEIESGQPASIVTVLDRSGSMVGSDYVDITQASTKAFIDLLSVNDRVGVVSFGNNATDEYVPAGSMATVTGQPIRDAAKTAVDNIAFNGCTFMGDGIQRAGALLTPEVNEKAMVLLSDGYDNKGCDLSNPAKPSAMDAATALPGDIPIYTCAMGPLSDQALLEDLADATGGRYYFMPTIFDLFEIYNYISGMITGDGVAANESSMASVGIVKGCVEAGAEHATFTVGWFGSGLNYVTHDPRNSSEIAVRLRSPSGKLIPANSSAVKRVVGQNHVALKLYEPAPGEWAIEVETARSTHTPFTAAIFVRSEVKIHLDITPSRFTTGSAIDFGVDVMHGSEPIDPLSTFAQVIRPQASMTDLKSKFASQLRTVDPDKDALADGFDLTAAKLLTLQSQLVAKGNPDLFAPVRDSVKLEKNLTLNRLNSLSHRPLGSNLVSSRVPTAIARAADGARFDFNDRVMTRAVAPTVLKPAVANVGRLTGGSFGGIVATQSTSALVGKIRATPVTGSYNVVASVTGIVPGTSSRFCRKALTSVLLRD